MARLLDQSREYIMTSDDAALIPVYPCLCDLDNLVWSGTKCKKVYQYIRENNNVLVEVRRGDLAESEDTKFVLVDLDKTTVSTSNYVFQNQNS